MKEKLFAVALFVFVFGTVVVVAVQHKAPGWKDAFCTKAPELTDFPAGKVFDGFRPSISGPAFDLSDWKKELIEATASAVNYAGDYVVIAKSCQKIGCTQHLMLNARTGYVVNIGLYGKKEAEYRPDSSLFVVETTATTSAQKTFYRIKDDKMELVCIEK